jgi:aminopeptidase N
LPLLPHLDQSQVTYREVDLLIDEAKASSQQRQRVASVVAHELAHQWFGNLVRECEGID